MSTDSLKYLEPVTLPNTTDDLNTRPLRFLLTERDVTAMLAILKHRYLMTHQVKTLVFPHCVNAQRTQQRLKLLLSAGYVGRKPTFTNQGGRGDFVWFVTSKGAEVLEQQGYDVPPVSRKNGHASSGHVLHTVAVADFRIRFEREMEQLPVSLETYLTDSDIRSCERRTRTSKTTETETPVLLHYVQDPHSGKKLLLYPDTLIVLTATATPPPAEHERKPAQRLLLLAEIDRGTEPMHVIHAKAQAYGLGLERGVFRQFDASATQILFVTTSERRGLSIRQAVKGTDLAESIWVTDFARIAGHTILSAPIWLDGAGRRRAILNTQQPPPT